MGLFGGLGRALGGLDPMRMAMAQAALAGDYGAMASIAARQQQSRADRAEAEAEAAARDNQIRSAKGLGFSGEELGALTPQDLSGLARERQQPRQFGAEGGSVFDPASQTWARAPARYTDQGRIIDINPAGQAREQYDARSGDINWQSGPWGAFATDRFGRPVGSGANITSPLYPGNAQPGQQPAAPPAPNGAPPGAPQAAPPAAGVDAIFSRMIQQESGGRQLDRNGRPLTSSAGAIGVAQVMPGTAPEAAQLAGLPFDANRYRTDPEYNAALGRAYFQEQLRTFGDPAMAVAAYNAGPQRVANAVQRGGQNWASLLPRETQGYLQSVLGEGNTQLASAQPTGRGIQEQAASGVVMAPPPQPPAQTPAQAQGDDLQNQIRQLQLAEERRQAALREEARAAPQQHARSVIDAIGDARRNISGWSTGLPGAALRGVPGTQSHDLRASIDTVVANIGFDRLQQMRAASPTGGALGQVSDFENRMLQSSLANLQNSQSRGQFVRNLDQVELHYLNVLNTIQGRRPFRNLREARRAHEAPGTVRGTVRGGTNRANGSRTSQGVRWRRVGQ